MTQIGSVELLATINTASYKKGAAEVDKANADMEKSVDKTSSNMNTGFSKVAKIGIAAMVAAAAAAGALIVSSFGAAIKRVDTLNNSARTFENMGFTATNVNTAMKALEKSIRGMPTSLDEAVRGMQMLTASTNDIGKSQKIFSAMNNAIIGFGGTSADVTNSVLQLSQAFAGGRIDAQTWNSMLNSGLAPALTAIARQMGITTKALKEGLSEGTISVETFQNALISMNEKGGGGMKSFEKISKDATSGIGTGWANLQTAVTRGVASIIQSIGSEDISNSITKIGESFEKSLKSVGKFVEYISRNSQVFAPLAVGISTIVTAITLWVIATKAMAIAQAALNIVLAANPIGIIIIAIAGLVAGLVYFFTKTKLGKAILESFFKTAMHVFGRIKETVAAISAWFVTSFNTVKHYVQTFWNGVVGIFNSVVDFFKKWGLTILAILFLPFTIGIGIVMSWKTQILAIFNFVADAVVAIFRPIISHFRDIFLGAWTIIKLIWDAAVGYFTEKWNFIVAVARIAAGFISDAFTFVVNDIKAKFNGIYGFFISFWHNIVNLFRPVGTFIGDALGGTFKSVINTVIRQVINMINDFINAINGITNTVNKIPGVRIGRIPSLGVPQLAEGGIISSPTLAMVGEGKEAEAVIPLSKLDKMLDGNSGSSRGDVYNIKIDLKGIMSRSRSDEREIGKNLIKAVNEELKSQGKPVIPVGA